MYVLCRLNLLYFRTHWRSCAVITPRRTRRCDDRTQGLAVPNTNTPSEPASDDERRAVRLPRRARRRRHDAGLARWPADPARPDVPGRGAGGPSPGLVVGLGVAQHAAEALLRQRRDACRRRAGRAAAHRGARGNEPPGVRAPPPRRREPPPRTPPRAPHHPAGTGRHRPRRQLYPQHPRAPQNASLPAGPLGRGRPDGLGCRHHQDN